MSSKVKPVQDQASIGDEMKKANGEALWSAPTTGPLSDPSLAAKEADEMPPNNEQILQLLLRMEQGASQRDAQLTKILEGLGAKDKTSVPNWIMTTLVGILITFIGFAYTTIDRNQAKFETDMKNQLSTQELLVHDMREKLIAHGWKIDANDSITPPADLETVTKAKRSIR